MKVSIITATFNSLRTINDCINSVNNQIYSNIDHLIIDGASIDNTVKIVNTIPNRVTNIISEPDNGIYDALNKGIKLASGDIIGFLHSDDLLASSQTIQNIVNAFGVLGSFGNSISENTGMQQRVDVVYGDLVYVDKNNPEKLIRYWKSQPFKPELLRRGWMPAHPTVFIRREVYEKNGLFDLSFKISADYDFMLRVFSDPTLRFVYLPEVITRMRVGGESNKSIRNIIQKSKEDYRAICKNNIPFPAMVLFIKNISKIPQFFRTINFKNKENT